MNDPITSGDVSICNSGVVNRDLSISRHFDINEVSLHCGEPTIVHCSCVKWFRKHVVLHKSLQIYNSVAYRKEMTGTSGQLNG